MVAPASSGMQRGLLLVIAHVEVDSASAALHHQPPQDLLMADPGSSVQGCVAVLRERE